jgi:uncharacterized membrane protein
MAEQKKSNNNFSLSEAISFSWNIAIKNLWLLVGVLLIPYGIRWILSLIAASFIQSGNGFEIALGVLTYIIDLIFYLEVSFAGMVIYFKLVDKKKVGKEELFKYFDAKLLYRFFLISFVYALITFVGIVLFVIPGIYFATKYWFAGYIYVDKRTGVVESFKESARLTQGIKMKLFYLGILQVLIQIGGLLALLVGLFIAVPINYLSDIYVYRKITKTLK